MNSHRPNVAWRKNRLAARVLYRKQRGKRLRPRDYRIVDAIAEDECITDRLLGQALFSLEAQYGVAR
jgi:hypothetical protein